MKQEVVKITKKTNNLDMLCYEISRNEIGIWSGLNTNTDTVTMKVNGTMPDTFMFMNVPASGVLHEDRLADLTNTRLVLSSSEIVFGKDYLIEIDKYFFIFPFRNYQNTINGYKLIENKEQYQEYLGFLKKQYKNHNVFVPYSGSTSRIVDAEDKQLGIFE